MLINLNNVVEKYYQFWTRLADTKSKVRILPIDFNTSWTRIIWIQKKYFLGAFFCETLIQIFYTLVPLFIGAIIEQQRFSLFVYLTGAWLLAIVGEFAGIYCSILLQMQCINSIQYNAYQFFLCVDPLYHTLRSSGKLFAKIERGARAYEDFLDLFMLDLVPTVMSIFTVIASFLWIDVRLGLLCFILLLVIAVANITLSLLTGAAFEKKLIDADDSVKALSVESLTQVQLVRSAFATNEIARKAYNKNNKLMFTESTAWVASSASTLITRILYLGSIFILGTAVIKAILSGTVSTLIGTTILLAYIRGTYEIIKIGRRLRKLLKSVTRISDLFLFVRTFGKQSFPVLSNQLSKQALHEVEEKIDSPTITISITNLDFEYNTKAKIFESHHLSLEAPATKTNKLYGIIGPSGMGKTTLLSIIGGQLKPSKGSITINGIDVYSIDDSLRKRLVAIQGQIASSLSGTLRSNLLLGLPHDKQVYTDKEMVQTLKEVGLWSIFEEKDGLNTLIGESGLTISGGQRQRLNFAGLYLRAMYYNPRVILIDEPTSSLDEISEKAITTMISHLAQHAITLVIAHRIKTIENAIGIMDFSLLSEDKDIKFYNLVDLEKKSLYYRRLIQGHIKLDI
ncbi:ABC transporter ATP-binding protein [Candidatus Dependentiae bacterium]|nr:ABC transporter ATP-binding protein [Candidatus Dependentiae bacterium]